jgi:hypothetical protein
MSAENLNDPAQNDGNTLDVEHESIDHPNQLPQKGLPPSPISRLGFILGGVGAVGSAVVGGLLTHNADSNALTHLQNEVQITDSDFPRAYAFVIGNAINNAMDVFGAWQGLESDFDVYDARYEEAQGYVIQALENTSVFRETFPLEQAPKDQVARTKGRQLGQVNKYESFSRLVTLFQHYGEGLGFSRNDTGLYLLAYAYLTSLPGPLLQNPSTEANFKRQDAFGFLERLMFVGSVLHAEWTRDEVKQGVQTQLWEEVVELCQGYNLTPNIPNLLSYLVKTANGENIR